MKPSIQTLGQILYSPSQYIIPVFQRNYRWETPEWAKLWDSLREIQEPGKIGNHFMGFLVFVPGLPQPGQHTKFHLIDGQQRLATCSIVLAAIRNVAREVGQFDLAEEIHEFYLVHPLKRGDQHYRLLPKERDHDSYLALVSNTGEVTGRMADALDYFEQRLSNHVLGTPENLRQLFDTLCQRLEFMCATLEAENAYNIFKSLNSTGVPLGPSDLIRNFVFMHVLPDDQDEFDKDLWGVLEDRFARSNGTLNEEKFSRYFRDFLMAEGRYIAPKNTFATFEARFEATEFSPKALAKTLIVNADYYEAISNQQPDASPIVSRSIAGLNALESSTTYPLLLTLFRTRAAGAISAEQLGLCVEMLRGFILRRFVCGLSSRGYGQMFVRALSLDKGDPVKTLEAYLLDRGWPDDHQFESAFIEFPLYERGYTRPVLETLERLRGHKEPADLSAAEVEHVMPQTLSDLWVNDLGPDAERVHAEWLHRPGNLTLSGYNQELWNHPFEIKRKRYSESNIVITREIPNYSHWGEVEMRERGGKLARDAARIWLGPSEQIAPLSQDNADADNDDSPGRREVRLRFWVGLKDYLVEEHPELPDFEARPSWTIRIPSGVRHVGFELRFGLRQNEVGIDVWFWRAASLTIWERIRAASDSYNDLFEAEWEFEQGEGQTRARMSLNHEGDVRSENSWPDLYRWLGAMLSLVYTELAPRLGNEMFPAP